jgi:DNA-binding CsgD family transcriptional regulator
VCCNIVENRITSSNREATAAMDRALHSLLWAGTGSALKAPVLMPRNGRRPILAFPVRLSTISANVFAECQVIVVFLDMERRPKLPAEVLSATYFLTPAETRLAVRISSGEDLESISHELRLSKETLRNQIKSCISKNRRP